MTAVTAKSVTFGWQAPRKRLRTAPQVHEELGTAFAAREEEIEDELLEPSPLVTNGQLEDAGMKVKRLRSEGALLAEAERFAEALQHWEEALLFTEDPCEKAPILEQMAQVLLILERSFDAIRTAEQAVQCRPLWYAGHHTLGRALLSFGELERAVEAFRRAKTLLSEDLAANKTASAEEEFHELCLELADAEKLWCEVKDRAKQKTAEVIVNGRVVESHFWQTAMKVTYDSDGRPTTHFPPETMGTPNAA